MNIVNILSVQNFRELVPVNILIDDSFIITAINNVQVADLPSIIEQSKIDELITQIDTSTLTTVNRGLLIKLATYVAYRAASRMVTLVGEQFMPQGITSPDFKKNQQLSVSESKKLSNYYVNMSSAALKAVYAYCDANNIKHNRIYSTNYCQISI